MNFVKTNLINVLVFSTLAFGGDYYKSVIIQSDEHKPCCDCHCEYDASNGIALYPYLLQYKYKYFGGVPHVCIGEHIRDEKGVDLTKPHKPHVCTGEWCDAKCCFSLDDYFHIKYKQEESIFGDIKGNNIKYPVIPTPPPVSADH